ncbi:MAG: exonuclease [Spirochaetia bacterium]|jgi:DNA polymerase-3 subunit epsilon|nr:exonuclease [Spirochaetia bacterium]
MPDMMNFCAIDFETACPQRASACAVALVKVREGVLVDQYYTLIKPPFGMEILPNFSAIHGIRMRDVLHSPTFAEAWPVMQAFIGEDYLVAHNSSFDKSVLRYCLEYYEIDYPIPTFACTVQCARRTWPTLMNHKLDTVSRHLGIQLKHHEALSDSLACAKIYLAANALPSQHY